MLTHFFLITVLTILSKINFFTFIRKPLSTANSMSGKLSNSNLNTYFISNAVRQQYHAWVNSKSGWNGKLNTTQVLSTMVQKRFGRCQSRVSTASRGWHGVIFWMAVELKKKCGLSKIVFAILCSLFKWWNAYSILIYAWNGVIKHF